MDLFSRALVLSMEHYKVHILVFLIAFLAAITVAHPVFLLTDEWVSANQLSQLNEGHQALINEGKYGTFENGTPTRYFETRQNRLGYSLALPLISLPAEKLVYFFGDYFVFFILYLWIFLLIALALVVNAFFSSYSRVGKWRWTTGLIIVSFAGFLLNLFYYHSFPLTGKDSYPEIMAIVFTNIILFACLAMMVYEILRMIFSQPAYALFGTMVCLSCSSYLLWTNFCKDHALVAFLFTAILWTILRFICTDDPWNLAGGFFLSGLLVWARPEVGVFIFMVMCGLAGYFAFVVSDRAHWSSKRLRLIISPLFVIIGAIPFFINNFLYTKNPFLPVFVLWTSAPQSSVEVAGQVSLRQNTSDMVGSFIHVGQLTTNFQVTSIPADFFGIFILPHNGSMGVLPLIPVFLVAVLILPVLVMQEKIQFTKKERLIIATLLLLSLGIFLAYVRGISGMNISKGIVPDVRYLSPIYLPLTIIGLVLLQKVRVISEKPLELVAGMCAFWIFLLPLSLILILFYYPVPSGWIDLFPLLDTYTTIAIFIIALLFVIMSYWSVIRKIPPTPTRMVLSLLCALPLIWQIDASLVVFLFASGLGGYAFWIPVLQKICEVLAVLNIS
jgi:hypothetical protein